MNSRKVFSITDSSRIDAVDHAKWEFLYAEF